jgi:hypothetical protein
MTGELNGLAPSLPVLITLNELTCYNRRVFLCYLPPKFSFLPRYCLSLVIGFLFLGLGLAAQEYSYVDYTVKDGLAGTTTYCMDGA